MPLPTGALSLQIQGFGPFLAGVVDTANPAARGPGAARWLRNARYSGQTDAGRITVRGGTTVVATLRDDQATPQPVSAVCALLPFADGALAIGWSSATQKVYLYHAASDWSGWTDAAGAFHAGTALSPVGVLWSTAAGTTTAPGVLVAEGLGVAYAACTEAASPGGLVYPLRAYTPGAGANALTTPTADLASSGSAVPLYPLGCVSFQQHLWVWGVGAGTSAATMYEPEKARFSAIDFGADTSAPLFAASDSLTLGDRVRSARERILGAGLAGDALLLGGPAMLSRVTGYGRDSWYKAPVDRNNGFTSPFGQATVGDSCYFWSPRGPARVGADGPVEPLWDTVAGLVARVQRPERVRAVYDAARDWVIWAVDTGAGGRTWCAYDVRRGVFVGPDNDWGLAVGALGVVDALPPALAQAPPPRPDPASLQTTAVGTTSATATWTPADLAAATQLDLRVKGAATWTTVTTLPPGGTSYTFAGLSPATPYEWQVTALRFGIASSPSGGTAGATFTTLTPAAAGNTLAPPSNVALSTDPGSPFTLLVTWTPSGEASATTEVQVAGPSDAVPSDALYRSARTLSGNATSAVLRVAAAGVYWVRLRAVLPSGTSGFTDAANVYVYGRGSAV